MPADRRNGDFSANVAMVNAKVFRMPPAKAAAMIVEAMDLEDTYFTRAEVAGPGFMNFCLNDRYYADILLDIAAEGDAYGRSNYGQGKKVNVEFVSANPTGPIHMGNARGGALGDCLAAVLEWAGYDVSREFYINDAGKWKANEYVDLGCTVDGKRVMWATRNLGADNSSDFGWYYAWGETSGTSLVVSYDAEQQKDIYTSPYRTFDKTYYDDYVGLPACEPGGNLPSDKDAAHRYWRGLWHIPTKAEFESTIANTTPDGRREVYTASNGNSIFLPLAGGVYGSTPKQQGTSGTYWTSTFERNGALGPGAYSFYVQYRDTPQAPSVSDIIAYNGLPIRPVFCVE